MRHFIPLLPGAVGVLSIVAANPVNAELVRQNFGITVDRIQPPTATSVPFAPPLDPALVNLPAPPIGTVGRGFFTYDTSRINYIDEPSGFGRFTGYFLGRPNRIEFSEFSLNFADRTYTQIIPLQSRVTGFLAFDRNAAGQYTPTSLNTGTTDGSSVVRIFDDFFTYRPGPEYFPGEYSVVNSASGSFRFTESEVVPEPPTAIAAGLAIGFGYLFHRKRTRKSLTRKVHRRNQT